MTENCVSESLRSIDAKLRTMKQLVSGVAQSKLKAIVIDGEPGIGKTYEVLDHLDKNFIQDLKDDQDPITVTRYTGHITPLSFYHALGDNCKSGNILIFDDCDDSFTNIDCLNLLKAAVDTRTNRVVSWRSGSAHVRYKNFTFDGGVIIITNAKMDSRHYRAFLDRVHLYTVEVTTEEKLARIWSIATSTDGIDPVMGMEVCDWLRLNVQFLESLSLRTFIKLAELASLSENWRDLAKATLFSINQEMMVKAKKPK